MTHLILGGGEIGSAYARLLEAPVVDIMPGRSQGKPPKKVDVLHVCIRHSKDFEFIVREAIKKYKPSVLNNMATCPPGTTERFEPLVLAAHSTTRGLHPRLDEFILHTPKHIGGPGAAAVAKAFEGVLYAAPVLHDHSRTTEAIHVASNFAYAASLMAADEINAFLRFCGVDYVDYMNYEQSHNAGYKAMGIHSKMRPVLFPPGGKLGGHCIKLAAELVPQEVQGPIMQRLRDYG